MVVHSHGGVVVDGAGVDADVGAGVDVVGVVGDAGSHNDLKGVSCVLRGQLG